jgi:hypothetical protein
MSAEVEIAIAAKAAQGFDVLHCYECAAQIEKALQAHGLHGRRIEIRGAAGREIMVCLRYQGGNDTITITGWHVGIWVRDLMFDNLHPDGIPFDQWVKDFDAPGGMIVASDTAF